MEKSVGVFDSSEKCLSCATITDTTERNWLEAKCMSAALESQQRTLAELPVR